MKAYVFPGQGSQVKGMGEGLFERYPEETAIADQILGYSIADLCLKDEHHQLHQTQYTQPALYVVNALFYKEAIANVDIVPDYLAGHSLGEYNALQASGAISFEDGLQLVKKRGELMSQAPKGAMAAILGSTEADIRLILDRNELSTIDIANYNAPDQTVLSGLMDDIGRAQAFFDKEDIKFIPLNTSGAFHSRYMTPSGVEFKKYLQTFTFSALTIPVISNVHAKPYEKSGIIDCLSAQISHSVKWSDSICYLLEKGVTEFSEIGIGVVLTTLVEKIREQFQRQDGESTSDAAGRGAVPTSAPVTETKEGRDFVGDEQKNDSLENQDVGQIVANWNKTYPIGSKVSVKNYDELLETRTNATVLFGRRAAVYMKGFNGYFDLTEITPDNSKSR